MKHFLTLLLLFSLLVPMGLASADDPAIGSKEDNACNAGGTMEGKCDTPWAWVCGYYLAHWLSNGGWNTPNNPFNDSCVSILPPRPQEQADTEAGPIIFILQMAGQRITLTLDFYPGAALDEGDYAPYDGIADVRYLLLNDNVVGDSGLCATYGWTYDGDIPTFVPVVRNWFYSLGFVAANDSCRP